MKYTFLLPAYKSSYLKDCLLSILSQTYQDFTVLVSDDFSPEPIYDIIQPFLSDKRVFYRRNPYNIGAEHLVTHWNLLLKMCQSPFFILAGDDDIYESTFLQEIDNLINSNPNTDIFRCKMDKINQDNVIIETEAFSPLFNDSFELIKLLFDKKHLHAIGAYVFRTNKLKELGGFIDFPLAWFSDDGTIIKMSSNGISCTSSTLFHARNSGKNISSRTDNNQALSLKAQATISFFKWYNCYLREASLYKRSIVRSCREYCYDRLMNIYYRLPVKDKLNVIRVFPLFMWTIIKDQLNIIIKRG